MGQQPFVVAMSFLPFLICAVLSVTSAAQLVCPSGDSSCVAGSNLNCTTPPISTFVTAELSTYVGLTTCSMSSSGLAFSKNGNPASTLGDLSMGNWGTYGKGSFCENNNIYMVFCEDNTAACWDNLKQTTPNKSKIRLSCLLRSGTGSGSNSSSSSSGTKTSASGARDHVHGFLALMFGFLVLANIKV